MLDTFCLLFFFFFAITSAIILTETTSNVERGNLRIFNWRVSYSGLPMTVDLGTFYELLIDVGGPSPFSQL